jgi:non-specific serine/threonine protein kinase
LSGSNADLSELMQSEAIRLFVERGAAAKADFALTTANARSVGQVCRDLDGIPLAIELAAARVNALTPQEIAARVADRFQLLTVGARTAPPRHQTLRAAMDWSYDLLTTAEQTLFRRLTVFVGGFRLDGAGVMNDSGQEATLDILSHLVDKSLVIAESHGEEMRYHMLETLREYGRDRLAECGERDRARRGHLRYFLEGIDQYTASSSARDKSVMLARVDEEHHNFLAALSWAEENKEYVDAAKILNVLGFYWLGRAPGEGRRWLESALERSPYAEHTVLRATALRCAGRMASFNHDYPAAVKLNQRAHTLNLELGDAAEIAASGLDLGAAMGFNGDAESGLAIVQTSLGIFRELQDMYGIAGGLNDLGNLQIRPGHYDQAKGFLEESLVIYSRLGDPQGMGYALNNLGNLALEMEEWDQAVAYLNQALALRREYGDKRGIAATLSNLGRVALARGDEEEAKAQSEEALLRWRALDMQPNVAKELDRLAQVARRQGDVKRAAAHYRECLTVWARFRNPSGAAAPMLGLAVCLAESDPCSAARLLANSHTLLVAGDNHLNSRDQADFDHLSASLQEELGESSFMEAWSEGTAMTSEHAVELVSQVLSHPDWDRNWDTCS